MSIQSFNAHLPRSVHQQSQEALRITSREASEIVLETLTALYISIHARIGFNPNRPAKTELLTPVQLNHNIPNQRKASFLRENGLELGEWASEKAALRQLQPFRMVGDPSGEFSAQRNHLAMIASTSIQNIYYPVSRETGIESNAHLFTQATRRSLRYTLPTPSLTPLITLLESSITIASLRVYKSFRLETTALANWEWKHQISDDELEELQPITVDALQLTHDVLKRLSETASSSQDSPAALSINQTFHAIHRMAIKIIHDQDIILSNFRDVNNTSIQTIELLNRLVNDFIDDTNYGNFMMGLFLH